MALEQKYNRDIEESSSGLTGITLDEKARAKWVYTKPVLSEVSAQFKVLMNMPISNSTGQHREEGKAATVIKIVECIKQKIINPFLVQSENLLNIATGQAATSLMQTDLTKVVEIGNNEISQCLKANSSQAKKIKLHTFKSNDHKAKEENYSSETK